MKPREVSQTTVGQLNVQRQSGTPEIPLELWNLVIDLFAGDRLTLRVLAVTCRAFLRRSRYHLFQCTYISPRFAPSFIRMCHSDPGSCYAIKELHLNSLSFSGQDWTAENAQALLSLLRGVDKLRVVDASVFPRAPGAFPVLPTFMLSEKATQDILADAAGHKKTS